MCLQPPLRRQRLRARHDRGARLQRLMGRATVRDREKLAPYLLRQVPWEAQQAVEMIDTRRLAVLARLAILDMALGVLNEDSEWPE